MANVSEQIKENESSRNVWGTVKALINADEFCQDCEHSVPRHYTNCPQYTETWRVGLDT